MSDMYAGQLCATQVGDRITIDGEEWWLHSVSHRHDRDTVRLVVRKDGGRNTTVFDVAPESVVTVDNPSYFEGWGDPEVDDPEVWVRSA